MTTSTMSHMPGKFARAWSPWLMNARQRLLASALPAALVTAGLFGAMTGLIQVREVQLAPAETRILESIVYSHEEPSDVIYRHEFPAIPEAATPPPPPQVSAASKGVSMPPIVLAGSAPQGLPIDHIKPILTGPQPIGDRIATAVRLPMPTYPASAVSRGLEGDCDVRFDIAPRGTPFNVKANCTHSIFESEARRAVERAEFLPQIVNGHAVESYGAVYPLEFRFDSGR
ncbi:energy transducer TonB [Hyphomonas pacifica]|nr:energy transducer TonB [Hyphomonas pacifica]